MKQELFSDPAGGMDMPVERKHRFRKKHYYGLAGAGALLLFCCYLLFRDTASSLKVEKEQLTIASVRKGEFNDYIRVIGQVVPRRIIYLDAVEGGRVEERVKEEGAPVKAGDVILRLSNPLLNIGIMQNQADLAYQENELRNTRISMEQERLRLAEERIGLDTELTRSKRRYEQFERLYDEELISREEYLTAREDYESARDRRQVVLRRIEQEDSFRSVQLASLDENIRNMKRSLALVRERLENLKVKAPIDGQLGNLDAQIGQSIAQGERIGQIITPELKIQALIDEHYVEQVLPGLPAGFEREGKDYTLEVSKVYPEVREGQFRTDLYFTSARPENIRAGQTYHINLQLGDPVQAILIPRGGFYQASGGQYVYVVDAEEKEARRRPVKIGRQNPQYYEVIEGLQPGEKVIVSGYELFGENERLLIR